MADVTVMMAETLPPSIAMSAEHVTDGDGDDAPTAQFDAV